MKTTGKIVAINLSFLSKQAAVTFEVTANPEDIEQFQNMDLDIEFDKHREKRSLDSNNYFHAMTDKLRQKLGITMAECKNHLIASYGQIEYIGDQVVYIKTQIEPKDMLKQDSLHTWLVKTNPDGTFMYRVYRGTHTYNTAEMAKLIDGTVLECKAQGIETATPEEIRKMNERWGLKLELDKIKKVEPVQGELNLES